MIRDYNYHNWSKFMVQKPEEQPKGEHYAAVLFDTRSEYSPPWDKHDTGSSYSVPQTIYFAFLKKEDLEMWVGEASKSNKKFFFFHVTKLGEANLQVKVNTDL